MKKTNKPNLYDTITNKILEQLAAGTAPWHKPWGTDSSGTAMPLRINGQPYQGVNVLLLWGRAGESGFKSCNWMTYRQAQELGGHVRKGEHGEMVVYANTVRRVEEVNGEEKERAIPFLKSYVVFNADQIDGLPAQYYIKATTEKPEVQRHADAEKFITHTGAAVRFGGIMAAYNPSLDLIKMPHAAQFEAMDFYYSTMFHELTHWTGHAKRCARDFSGKRDAEYAKEELIAEMGAAFLCGHFGVNASPRADHASYIAAWLKLLNDDNRAIFKAASAAQKAVNFLLKTETQTEAMEQAA